VHPCGESAGGVSRHQLGWPKVPRRLGWQSKTGLAFGLGRATSDRRSRHCPRPRGVLSGRRTEFESPCLFHEPDAVHRRVWHAGVSGCAWHVAGRSMGIRRSASIGIPCAAIVASELVVTAPGDHAAPGGQIVDPFDFETHLRVGLHRVPLHTVDGVSINAAAVVDVAYRHDIGHLPLIQPMPPITSLCRSCSISMGLRTPSIVVIPFCDRLHA
jgi:hypothetical protein